MDEWNRHCRSGRQCGSAIQGLDRIGFRYLTDWVYSAITVAVAVAKWEGYGKLADWVCDGSGALLATACRTEVSNSDDTVRLNNQHSRGLTVGHAAHAVDFNRRPILSRQNVLALFRIPTASTNRAAELHEYQRSGFDDGEPFAVVQGYGMLSAGQYEFLPCFLHVLEDAQIGLEVIPCGGLDVGVSELPCDHADVGSGLDRQRAERVAQVAWRHAGQFHALAPTAVVVCHLVRVQTADQSAGLRAVA